jgi:cold shock CspA family protein
MSLRKSGTIENFNAHRRFGWITSVEYDQSIQADVMERFFFYSDRVVKGPVVPTRGQVVTFDVSSAPVKAGHSRLAVNLQIEPTPVKVPSGVLDALSGKSEDKQSGGVQ